LTLKKKEKRISNFFLFFIFNSIMEFSSRASELATLLESKMTHFSTNLKLDEIGRVVSVGDGIARVYGLNEIQAGREKGSDHSWCSN